MEFFLFSLRRPAARPLAAFILLSWVVLFGAVPVEAQYAGSTLMGTVRSEIGQPIPSVRVEWIQSGQVRMLETEWNLLQAKYAKIVAAARAKVAAGVD